MLTKSLEIFKIMFVGLPALRKNNKSPYFIPVILFLLLAISHHINVSLSVGIFYLTQHRGE